MTTRAAWDTAYINRLPDAAFAAIKPGGKKDDQGKTVPRSLRLLPHHNASVKLGSENSSVDLPHLRNALARVSQVNASAQVKAAAKAHLKRHAKALLKDVEDMNLPPKPVEKLPPDYQELFGLMGALQARNEDEDMIRRTFGVRIKADSVDEGSRSVRVIASSEALDSYDEIVEQDWNLKRYQANPVVLFAHNKFGGLFASARPQDLLPIGHASDVGLTKDGQLEATLNFVDEKANPLAEQVWQGYLQGSLRAVSVGFRSNDIREEKRDGKDVFVLSQNDLFEISAAPMGANPEAVAKSADGQSVRERNRDQLRTLAAKQVTPAVSGPATEELEMAQKNAETPAVSANSTLVVKGPNERHAVEATPEPSAPEVKTEPAPEAEPVVEPPEAKATEPEVIDETEPEEQLETDALTQLENGDEDLTETCVLLAADLETAKKALKSAAEVQAELEQTVAELTEKRDALEGELNVLCVKAYLGKKIVPAEEKTALEDCARSGRADFCERMLVRPNLTLTEDESGEDPSHKNDVKSGSNTADRIVQKTMADADKAAVSQTPSTER